MYPTSAAYKTAIQQNVRDVRITGTITLKDNSVINITDDDIVQGSLYVTEQCVAGEDIEVGNVYASEMGLSLSTPLENPYSLDGARVHIYFGIDVGSLWEYVPLGYFYVTEIQRKANNVNLTALDGMLLFDVEVGDPGSSSPRNFIVHACQRAGVTLGTSVFEIDTFANAGVLLAAPDASKIKTCRDLLMWACQIMGAFARMNRSGELEIVPIKARTSVKTISKGERFNSDVSDFAVKITKVSMQVGETVYSRGTDGMTMVLDENPLMTGLSESQINAVLDNLLAQITTAVYVPFNSNFIGDPALQPGDFVTLSDTSVLGGGDIASIITHSTWRYRGPHNIKGAGKHGLVRGVQNQQMKAVSSIVAIARAAQDLALAANQSTQLIKDAIGGHVLIRQNPDETNEILIMDNPDPDQAVKIWRWNMGGLGYSDNCVGADNPDREYEIAMTMDGAINANFIKTGQLDAGVVRIGPETTFAPGYDPSQIEGASAVGMGVDSDCTGLWHFDGSLNSHKGVSATFTRASVAYLEDGTQVPAGQPRFEPGKFGQAVLVEEGTTNSIVDPVFAVAASWPIKSLTTFKASGGWAQDTCVTLCEGSSGTGFCYQYQSLSDGQSGALSVYVKMSDGSEPVIGGGTNQMRLVFGGHTPPVNKTYIGDGWWRLTAVITGPSSGNCGVVFYNADNTIYPIFSNIQLEKDKGYVTSFTPSTRSPETLTIPTAGVLNPQEGTVEGRALFPDFSKFANISNWRRIWGIGNNASLGHYSLHWQPGDAKLHFRIVGSSVNDIGITPPTPGWHYWACSWSQQEMALFIDGVKVGYINNPVLPTSFIDSVLAIGGRTDGLDMTNTLHDELRIDKIARTDEEIQAWYKANAPFYTSEDMKQWPGYVKVETDGLKVYDSSDDLRVLVGSWLKDAVRKYGIKIIEGELYGSFISTGTEDSNISCIKLYNEQLNGVLSQFGMTGTEILRLTSTGDQAIFKFLPNEYYGAGIASVALGASNKLSLSGYNGISLSGATEIIGGLDVFGGAKNCVDPTENYGFRAMSAVEAPEILFYDRGQVDLVNGEATVYLDPIFLEMIEPNTELTPWQIWVECYGENGVYVSEVGADYFKVKERNGGTSNNKVIWRFEAIRKNYAGIRLMEVV